MNLHVNIIIPLSFILNMVLCKRVGNGLTPFSNVVSGTQIELALLTDPLKVSPLQHVAIDTGYVAVNIYNYSFHDP